MFAFENGKDNDEKLFATKSKDHKTATTHGDFIAFPVDSFSMHR